MGLKLGDLFSPANGRKDTSRIAKRKAATPSQKREKRVYANQVAVRIHVLVKLQREHGDGVSLAGTWEYPDFLVDRWNLPTPEGEKQRKEFRPYYKGTL